MLVAPNVGAAAERAGLKVGVAHVSAINVSLSVSISSCRYDNVGNRAR